MHVYRPLSEGMQLPFCSSKMLLRSRAPEKLEGPGRALFLLVTWQPVSLAFHTKHHHGVRRNHLN